MENLLDWVLEGTYRVTTHAKPLRTIVRAFDVPREQVPNLLVRRTPSGFVSEIYIVETRREEAESPTAAYMNDEPEDETTWVWKILVTPEGMSQDWIGVCFTFSLLFIERMHTDAAMAYAFAYRERRVWKRVLTHFIMETALMVFVDLSPSLKWNSISSSDDQRRRRELLHKVQREINDLVGPPRSRWEAECRTSTINNIVGQFYLDLHF